MRPAQKLHGWWTWYEGDDLHFCDENDIEHSRAVLRTEIPLLVLLFRQILVNTWTMRKPTREMLEIRQDIRSTLVLVLAGSVLLASDRWYHIW